MNERITGNGATVQVALSGIEADAVGVASVAELAEPRLRAQVEALTPEARSIVVFASTRPSTTWPGRVAGGVQSAAFARRQLPHGSALSHLRSLIQARCRGGGTGDHRSP